MAVGHVGCVLVPFLNKEKVDAVFTLQTVFD